MSAWMLYGAYGTTGRIVLAEALRRGHRPLLAGRDSSRLATLAGEVGLESIALSLEGSHGLTQMPRGITAVLNAAGPYFRTGDPLRGLCLGAGASYVDLNGEMGDFQQALRCDAVARAKGIAIIPGAGFGVVFGEALAAHAGRRLPGAQWMKISVAHANAGTSRGAAQSTASVLAGSGYVIAGGRLTAAPMAFPGWRVRQAPGIRFGSAPLAELVAAHRLTGIADIVAGVPVPLGSAMALRIAGPLIGKLMSKRKLPDRDQRPSSSSDALTSRVWVEAGNSSGQRVLSVLETGEGYGMAAAASVRAMEGVIALRPVGAMTPAQAFGPSFALSLPGTGIADL